ncbi:MAG: hypothetical protein JSU83_05365, partial [Deltaproteobacteria bacterium]
PAKGLRGFCECHGAFWDQDAGCSGGSNPPQADENQKLSESRGPQVGPRSSSFDLALRGWRPQNDRRREQMDFKPL